MANMIFAYTRVSTNGQTTDSQVVELKQAFPDLEEENIIQDVGVSGTVPASQREGFKSLSTRLRKGDVLAVWWIDRLGRDYHDIKATISKLLTRGVIIKTVNAGMTFQYTGNDMTDMMTDTMLNMLGGFASAERKNRLASADAGRKALLDTDGTKGKAWGEKFAGRKADDQLHAAIIEELDAGMSIRATASKLGCNPSTVQRVKKAKAESDNTM